jgi:hypothetical protein
MKMASGSSKLVLLRSGYRQQNVEEIDREQNKAIEYRVKNLRPGWTADTRGISEWVGEWKNE